jgi:hypothetical protein
VSFDEETVLIQILLHTDLSSNENILYETFDEAKYRGNDIIENLYLINDLSDQIKSVKNH